LSNCSIGNVLSTSPASCDLKLGVKMTVRRFTVAALGICLSGLTSAPAQAAVSPKDGYAVDGAPVLHFDVVPYLWLPATDAQFVLGNGAQVDIDNGVPSISSLLHVLKGAFLGAGVARYGHWSGVLDIQFIDAAENKGLPALLPGVTRNLKMDVSYVRVAPGVGYQIYNGLMGTTPATLDGRIGFSWLQLDESLKLDQMGPAGNTRISDINHNSGFVQPWMGLTGAVYPWENWRFQVETMVEGFGVSGGSWGWGASALLTWAANDWLNVSAGYRALHTDREEPSSAKIRSVDVTAYGPMVGVGFSF